MVFEGATAADLIAMVRKVHDGQDGLHKRIDDVQATLSTTQQSIIRIEADVSYLKDSDERKLRHLDKLHDRITALEADENRREGRDGAWAALLKNPVVVWIFGLAVAVWTFFSGGHGVAK